MSEVTALPAASPVRALAEPVLLTFQHILQNAPDLQPEEHELLMVMYKSWSEIREEGREEGREAGREEGRDDALRETLRKQLAIKFGDLSPEANAEIAGATTAQLDRYLERILVAESLAAVLA